VYYFSSINNGYSMGNVSGDNSGGGIAGMLHDSSITNGAAINSAIGGGGANVCPRSWAQRFRNQIQ
jgi:hypothetical protein